MNQLSKKMSALLLLLVSNCVFAEAVLTDLQGNKIAFSSLKGKWVLINYWASWCQPCLEEISELNAFYKSNKDKIALYAVNFDNVSVTAQRALARKLGIRYPSLAKNPAATLGLGAINGVPATFVFDPNGHLQQTLYGSQTHRSLYKIIAAK